MRIIITTLLLCTFKCLFAQKDSFNIQLDTVFMTTGDTLLGKVAIDKDNDRFIFEARDTFTFQLLPNEVKKFTYNLPEHNGEKTTYISIVNHFYFLEFGQNAAIQGYARYSYSAVENDGPKYFVTTKKYFFFKGKAAFFPRPESFKNDLLILVDDCSKLVRKIQFRDIKIEDIATYILEYNNCNGRIRK
jgi:hypothetical protein